MRSYSGILVIDPKEQRQVDAYIDFDRFPSEGADLGGARLAQRRNVGGTGKFQDLPTYVVHFREYVTEDKGRGKSEHDTWKLDSRADHDGLLVKWAVEKGAAVREVGFLVVGC